jgi:hypothetical protein
MASARMQTYNKGACINEFTHAILKSVSVYFDALSYRTPRFQYHLQWWQCQSESIQNICIKPIACFSWREAEVEVEHQTGQNSPQLHQSQVLPNATIDTFHWSV